jgi:hypothetical protein
MTRDHPLTLHGGDLDINAGVQGRLRTEELHRRGSSMLSRRRSSELSLEDRADGELGRYLEEEGWDGEWDAAVRAVIITLQARRTTGEEPGGDERPSPRKVTTGWSSPRGVRRPEVAHTLPRLNVPGRDPVKLSIRPDDQTAADAPRVDARHSLSFHKPQPISITSPQSPTASSPRWPTSPTSRRAAIARPSPRTTAESVRLSEEMEENPFAKLRESRRRIREWRPESVWTAACSAINHEDFIAQVSKSVAGSKLMIAREDPTSSQHGTLTDTAPDSSTSTECSSAALIRTHEPRAPAIVTPTSPACGVSPAQISSHSGHSPRARAHPFISARLYAAASPKESTSKWPKLVSRAGCLEDKLNLLGNLVALEALQGGGGLSVYSGGRCGGSVAEATGGACAASELEGAMGGRLHDPANSGAGHAVSNSNRRVRMALPGGQVSAPLHPRDGDSETGNASETGEPAADDDGDGGCGGLFAAADSAARPTRGRERRAGVLPG